MEEHTEVTTEELVIRGRLILLPLMRKVLLDNPKEKVVKRIPLNNTEYELIEILAKRSGSFVTLDELNKELGVLSAHNMLHRTRKKLESMEKGSGISLKGKPGKGYQLNIPLDEAA